MIALQHVSKQYGGRLVLEAVDWRLDPGDRVGLVGPNGAGKSTLLKLVLGLEDADEGAIERPRRLRIGHLAQEPPDLGDRTLNDVMWDGLAEIRDLSAELTEVAGRIETTEPGDLGGLIQEQSRLTEKFEMQGGYEAQAMVGRVASGLGFSPKDLEAPVSALSGGWQMRAALGRLLLSRPDVLLLDEPTNHLDIGAIEWLESYLLGQPGALVAVSHDRRFLDRVTTRISSVEHGRVHDWTGNYSAYLSQRIARDEALNSAADRQDREMARARVFIERFRASATKSTAAKSREKAVDKIKRIEVTKADARVKFRFDSGVSSGKMVLFMRELSKGYGGKPVITGLDTEIERGMRLALVGPNGSGKSTLLRLLADLERLDGGEIAWGRNVNLGYYSQHAADRLDPDVSAIDCAYRAAPDRWSLFEVRSLLAGFLFKGDAVYKRVGILSGGEKARLALAILLLEPHNVLLLDEPTNHLDMESKDVLAEALAKFGGTVLLASHDRHVLDQVATHVMSLPDGRLFEGTYSDWSATRAAEREAAQIARQIVQARTQARAQPAAKPRMNAFKRERVLKDAEDLVMDLENRKTELEALLADPSSYVLAHKGAEPPDPALVVAEYLAVEKALNKANEAWIQLVDATEEA